jgi:ankyrin repeat protein
MNLSSIKTLADLIADSVVKLKNDFVNKLRSLSLTNGTSIADTIKFCIDNARIDLIDLIMSPSHVITLPSHGTITCTLSPFEYALSTGKFNVADEMIKHGFDINSIGACLFDDFEKAPPIIFAIRYIDENRPEILKFVLRYNPNLNIKYGMRGWTPLMYAIRNEEYIFAELLLQAGPDLMIKSKEGLDVFDYCDKNYDQPNQKYSQRAREFKMKMFPKLKIKTISDLIFRETKKGNTQLSEFQYDKFESLNEFILKRVKYGCHEFIEQFMDDIKEIFKSEENQHELFIWCVKMETINLLLKHGFNINSRSGCSDNYTVLMTATCMRSEQFVKLLIDAGANVNLVSRCGNTALHIAISAKEYDVANMLLDAKIDVTVRNKSGHDVWDMCISHLPYECKKQKWEIIKMRIERQLVYGIDLVEKTQTKHSEFFDVFINKNGDKIEIPKVEVIFIEPYWIIETNLEHVDFDIHPIEKNRSRSGKKLENGKWVDCEITFPRDHKYAIKVPKKITPRFHVITPKNGSWTKHNLIIRFDDFEYA